MTTNSIQSGSLILGLMRENPDDWATAINKKYRGQIKIGWEESDGLAIFNYTIKADFSDPVVQEARGIIIDYVNMKVVCWPFNKFGKYDEPYAASIDWNTAELQEKIDGCIIKIWWSDSREKWRVSTNKCIDASDAHVDQEQSRSIYNILLSADNFNELRFDALEKDKTYIFELVSPELPSVVKCDKATLYHIGTKNNVAGKEYDIDIGIKKPFRYDVGSLDEAISLAGMLNLGRLGERDGIIRHVDSEGFVAVDSNFNRIKVKSPIYMTIHHIRQASDFSRKTIIELIWDGRIDVQSICSDYPDIAHIIKWYDFKITEVRNRAKAFINICRRIYEILGDKGLAYKRVKDHKFIALFNGAIVSPDADPNDIIESLISKKRTWLINAVGAYKSENLSYMFDGIQEEAASLKPLDS